MKKNFLKHSWFLAKKPLYIFVNQRFIPYVLLLGKAKRRVDHAPPIVAFGGAEFYNHGVVVAALQGQIFVSPRREEFVVYLGLYGVTEASLLQIPVYKRVDRTFRVFDVFNEFFFRARREHYIREIRNHEVFNLVLDRLIFRRVGVCSHVYAQIFLGTRFLCVGKRYRRQTYYEDKK